MATVTRRDVERVKARHRDFGGFQGALLARMGAVISAQRATAAGALGAQPALRQSLVDLAAISEVIAENLRSKSIRSSG